MTRRRSAHIAGGVVSDSEAGLVPTHRANLKLEALKVVFIETGE
jgi:hypothetical protein